MRKVPDARPIARALAPYAVGLGFIAWSTILFLATYHLALAVFFHRSPA